MTTWVLLRGLAREARHWGGFPAALQQHVPAGAAVVTLDLPGNGSRWAEASPASVPARVEAARAELRRSPHPAPYVLVALSLGGMVALHWAAAAPRELRGCVLINSSVGALSPCWHRLRPGSYGQLLALMLPGRPAVAREGAILRLTSNAVARTALAPQWAAYARQSPVSRGNVLRQLAAALRYRGQAGAPAVPVLLLASREDRLVSVRCSRAMARAWGSPLREHGSAGHDLPLDDPDWVVRQLTGWRSIQ